MSTSEEPEGPEVRLSEATMAHLMRYVREAVQAGITNSITEENAVKFWQAGFATLQKNAAQQTGQAVMGGLWGLTKRLLVFVFAGIVVYAVGGWAALSGFAKALFSSGAP